MVIGIFGESCTGKSSLADAIAKEIEAQIYTGKDYLKLAKQEAQAKQKFINLLTDNEKSNDCIIYVIAEKEHLELLPPNAVRILMTASLDIIKERFAKRMNGVLPAAIAMMLENKHGMFNNEKYDLHIENGGPATKESAKQVINLLKNRH